ncbi:MAG: hypothetical protein WCI00_06890 [bacterium]
MTVHDVAQQETPHVVIGHVSDVVFLVHQENIINKKNARVRIYIFFILKK